MSDSDSGKKVGVFGGLIAAIGILLAKGADDCARIGAKGASITARESAPLIDDGARLAGRGAEQSVGLGDDALRGGAYAGELGGDPLRAAANAPHITPGMADDALGAASRSGKASDDIFEQGLDVSLEVVSFMDDESGADDDFEPPEDLAAPSGNKPALPGVKRVASGAAASGAKMSGVEGALNRKFVEAPRAIALLPATETGYEKMFGVQPEGRALAGLTLVTDLLKQPAKDFGMKDLAAMIAEQRASNPITILAYTTGVDTQIALPSGERVYDVELHEGCMNVGINCVIIACDPKSTSAGEPCARSAYFTWFIRASTTGQGGRATPLYRFTREIVGHRGRGLNGASMIISRVQRGPDGKLKLIRSRPRVAAGARPSQGSTSP
jgi:hypothetical protein